jgi:hypothetical protein
MLYYKNLKETILRMQDSLVSSNNIVIVSGYVGYQPIKELCETCKDVNITIIYGMYGCERIKQPLHNALVEIQNAYTNVTILYSTIPVHSKIYTWNCDDSIKQALIGSANFSVNGLMNDYKETLADVENCTLFSLKEYCEYIKASAINCSSPDVEVNRISKAPRSCKQEQPLLSKNICRISLTDKKGLVSKKSGLNWGLSNGHVSDGDAYIRISTSHIKLFPTLFPPKKYIGIENVESKGKKNRENDEIELIWDDGEKMMGLLEGQTNPINGLIYPKQLSSSPSKSILGKYIRKRLGVDIDHTITKTDLKRYGRSSIDISLIGEGIYYLDFSVKK